MATRSFWFSPSGAAALALISFASYFLLVEHRDHVFQALPYLILLACPLMHIFMHRHQGGGHHGGGHTSENEAYQRGLEAGREEERGRAEDVSKDRRP